MLIVLFVYESRYHFICLFVYLFLLLLVCRSIYLYVFRYISLHIFTRRVINFTIPGVPDVFPGLLPYEILSTGLGLSPTASVKSSLSAFHVSNHYAKLLIFLDAGL